MIDALLVDMLITDALDSGQATQQLRFDDQSPYLRIEVTSAPTAERPERSSPEQGVARLMLEELTHSWGVERGQRHRTAWAELLVTHQRTAHAHEVEYGLHRATPPAVGSTDGV